jgi:hypothetical protein
MITGQFLPTQKMHRDAKWMAAREKQCLYAASAMCTYV